MKRAILPVLLLAINIASHSQNLIVNPGFELWSNITRPVGWSTAQNCLKDSVNTISGIYSLRHEGGTTTKYLGQTIEVIPLRDYMLSMFYKTEITANGNGCRIWCYWKDNEGNSLSDPATDAILRPSKYMKSDVWDQFSTSISAPSNAAALYLEVRTYPNSIAYYDDFILEENIATSNNENEFSEIRIYPNPVCDNLNINNIHNFSHINIRSITGFTVWSSLLNGEANISIPVAELPDGLYIISIYGSGNMVSVKFIKN